MLESVRQSVVLVRPVVRILGRLTFGGAGQKTNAFSRQETNVVTNVASEKAEIRSAEICILRASCRFVNADRFGCDRDVDGRERLTGLE